MLDPETASAPGSAPDPWRTWEDTLLTLMHTGHGHALPRPDGMAQKCRKAPDCAICLDEVRGLQKALTALLEAILPAPPVSLFDTFPGELRLDPGEPLRPQGAILHGSGWYRVLDETQVGEDTLRAGTIVAGEEYRPAWLAWGVLRSILVPCQRDGTPIWPRLPRSDDVSA